MSGKVKSRQVKLEEVQLRQGHRGQDKSGQFKFDRCAQNIGADPFPDPTVHFRYCRQHSFGGGEEVPLTTLDLHSLQPHLLRGGGDDPPSHHIKIDN